MENQKISISELDLVLTSFSDFLGFYNEDEINEIKQELSSEGSYSDEFLDFYQDDDSEIIECTLILGSFEIIDMINSMKICEHNPYVMIVKDAWSGENEDGDDVGYVSFEALHDVVDPPTLKGGEYDKKSFMDQNELDEFYELCDNENVTMDDCKYQEFYFMKKSEYNEKEWIEKWLSQDYGHNKGH